MRASRGPRDRYFCRGIPAFVAPRGDAARTRRSDIRVRAPLERCTNVCDDPVDMRPKPKRTGATNYGEVPRARPRKAAPQGRAPADRPIAQPPAERVRRMPKAHAVGQVPNPRKPQLVRDVDGGALKDLFALLPDLPRPARPPARVRQRVATRALKRFPR